MKSASSTSFPTKADEFDTSSPPIGSNVTVAPTNTVKGSPPTLSAFTVVQPLPDAPALTPTMVADSSLTPSIAAPFNATDISIPTENDAISKKPKRQANLLSWKWAEVIDIESDTSDDEALSMSNIKRIKKIPTYVKSRNKFYSLRDED